MNDSEKNCTIVDSTLSYINFFSQDSSSYNTNKAEELNSYWINRNSNQRISSHRGHQRNNHQSRKFNNSSPTPKEFRICGGPHHCHHHYLCTSMKHAQKNECNEQQHRIASQLLPVDTKNDKGLSCQKCLNIILPNKKMFWLTLTMKRLEVHVLLKKSMIIVT